ncbi:MAG: STAS domain-containing protein [bacterium]|nr:STAS domain-containing protein [bacterium]
MSIELQQRGDVTLLRFEDRIVRPDGELEMRTVFAEQIEAGRRFFVFDLREVPYMDSAAVGEMVACQKRAVQDDSTVALLIRSDSKPEQLLRLTMMDRLFSIHYDEREALSGFV